MSFTKHGGCIRTHHDAQTSKCRRTVLSSKPFNEVLTVKLHISDEPHSDWVTSDALTSRKELNLQSSKSEQRERKEITGETDYAARPVSTKIDGIMGVQLYKTKITPIVISLFTRALFRLFF